MQLGVIIKRILNAQFPYFPGFLSCPSDPVSQEPGTDPGHDVGGT